MDNKYKPFVYYYCKLSEDEQLVYRQLLEGLKSHTEKCTVDKLCTTKQIKKILTCIWLENPLISYYDTYTMYKVGELVTSVEFNYYLSKEAQEEINGAMRKQALTVAAYARSKGPDIRNQVKAVHEYIVQWEYDHDFRSSSYSPAGALLYGRTVCKGVALTFKLVLDYLDIPSICVRGKHDGEGHAWNMAFYNNKYHFFDITFDMSATKNRKISYKNFERSKHPEKYEPWEEFELPYCAAMKGEQK